MLRLTIEHDPGVSNPDAYRFTLEGLDICEDCGFEAVDEELYQCDGLIGDEQLIEHILEVFEGLPSHQVQVRGDAAKGFPEYYIIRDPRVPFKRG